MRLSSVRRPCANNCADRIRDSDCRAAEEWLACVARAIAIQVAVDKHANRARRCLCARGRHGRRQSGSACWCGCLRRSRRWSRRRLLHNHLPPELRRGCQVVRIVANGIERVGERAARWQRCVESNSTGLDGRGARGRCARCGCSATALVFEDRRARRERLRRCCQSAALLLLQDERQEHRT
jgi:hypothetical protein